MLYNQGAREGNRLWRGRSHDRALSARPESPPRLSRRLTERLFSLDGIGWEPKPRALRRERPACQIVYIQLALPFEIPPPIDSLPPSDAQVARMLREYDRILRQLASSSCTWAVPFDECYLAAVKAADRAIRAYRPKGASLKTFLNKCVRRALVSLHRLKSSQPTGLPLEAAESVASSDARMLDQIELLARLPKRARAVAEAIASGCPGVEQACRDLGIPARHAPRIAAVLRAGLAALVETE